MKTDKTAEQTQKVVISFVSPTGASLGNRFSTVRNYYTRIMRQNDNSPQWIAEQVKQSLIRNIENGHIVVAIDGENKGIA